MNLWLHSACVSRMINVPCRRALQPVGRIDTRFCLVEYIVADRLLLSVQDLQVYIPLTGSVHCRRCLASIFGGTQCRNGRICKSFLKARVCLHVGSVLRLISELCARTLRFAWNHTRSRTGLVIFRLDRSFFKEKLFLNRALLRRAKGLNIFGHSHENRLSYIVIFLKAKGL